MRVCRRVTRVIVLRGVSWRRALFERLVWGVNCQAESLCGWRWWSGWLARRSVRRCRRWSGTRHSREVEMRGIRSV